MGKSRQDKFTYFDVRVGRDEPSFFIVEVHLFDHQLDNPGVDDAGETILTGNHRVHPKCCTLQSDSHPGGRNYGVHFGMNSGADPWIARWNFQQATRTLGCEVVFRNFEVPKPRLKVQVD